MQSQEVQFLIVTVIPATCTWVFFLTLVKGFLNKIFRIDTIWWYEKQLLMYAVL